MMAMNYAEQKIDVHLANLSTNINPALIRTFVTLLKSWTETPKVITKIERHRQIDQPRSIRTRKEKRSMWRASSILGHSKIPVSGSSKEDDLCPGGMAMIVVELISIGKRNRKWWKNEIFWKWPRDLHHNARMRSKRETKGIKRRRRRRHELRR